MGGPKGDVVENDEIDKIQVKIKEKSSGKEPETPVPFFCPHKQYYSPFLMILEIYSPNLQI